MLLSSVEKNICQGEIISSFLTKAINSNKPNERKQNGEDFKKKYRGNQTIETWLGQSTKVEGN